MAVLRSKRNISRYEYEHTFSDLYNFSRERTSRVSKRRKKWIAQKIDYKMNIIFNTIMEISEGRCAKGKRQITRTDLVLSILKTIEELEKPLMVLWNVEIYQTKKMAFWCSLIEKEIDVLYSLCDIDKCDYKIMILDWKKINETEFLHNMSELHRYVHGKVVNAKNCYDDTDSALLIELVDEAFHSLMKANQKIPTTKDEFEKRTKRISTAISCLNKMNRPMLFYFNTMEYSENTMREWSDKLTSELKMLYSLQKSDKTRFKNLP